MMNQGNAYDISLSVNGRKITDTLYDINIFSDTLPPEVAALLKSQLNLLPDNEQKPDSVDEVKINIKETMPPVGNNDPVKREIEAYIRAEKALSLEKSIPQHVQRALEQREAIEKSRNEKIEEFTIYESGVALGIVVGNTTKEEVFAIMKKYSKISFALNDSIPIHYYSDIFLYVFYDDEGIVQELKFVNDYKGKTSKGLKLGDSIEKAIEIYNQPKMKSPKGAVWDRFAVFCDYNIINSIRIQS